MSVPPPPDRSTEQDLQRCLTFTGWMVSLLGQSSGREFISRIMTSSLFLCVLVSCRSTRHPRGYLRQRL